MRRATSSPGAHTPNSPQASLGPSAPTFADANTRAASPSANDVRALEHEQRSLPLGAHAIAADLAARSDHAVARHDDGYRVRRQGIPYCPNRPRTPHGRGDLAVAADPPERDACR